MGILEPDWLHGVAIRKDECGEFVGVYEGGFAGHWFVTPVVRPLAETMSIVADYGVATQMLLV